MSVLVVENDRIRAADDIQLAEEILKLKNAGNHWGVINLLVNAWLKKTPEDVDAYKIELEDTKEMLDDKEFGQTKGGQDQERRFTMIFPQRLMIMIRAVYKPEELETDEEFFKDFARRYPGFKVAEKV